MSLTTTRTGTALVTFPAAGSIKSAAFWERLESVFAQMGYDVNCAPSYVSRGWCAHGKHPHGPRSRHFVARALDIGFDPPSGAPESDYEKAFLDVAVRMMEARYPGMFMVWNRGPGDHRDHAHFDDQNFPREGRYTGIPLPDGTIGFGMTGGAVVDLQRQLNARGARLATDGVFGLATFDALRVVQHGAGLVPDGLAGAATSAELARTSPPAPPVVEPKPSVPPTPPSTPPLTERVQPFRIAGPTGYATAAALDRAVLPSGTGVLLAARDSSDLVAAGAAAARHANVSVLPVARGEASLPPVITARLRELDPDWVRVVGGPLAVPDQAVMEALTAARVPHA